MQILPGGTLPPRGAQYIRVYLTLNTAIRNAIGVQVSEPHVRAQLLAGLVGSGGALPLLFGIGGGPRRFGSGGGGPMGGAPPITGGGPAGGGCRGAGTSS